DVVVDAVPSVEGQALATHLGQAFGVVVRGIEPDDFLTRPSIAADLRISDPEDFAGRDVIAIGVQMATRLNVGLGDSLTLIAPQGNATAFGTMPRMRAYEIAAIFDVGMYEYDSSFVYMPLEAAQIFFQTGTGVTALDVF